MKRISYLAGGLVIVLFVVIGFKIYSVSGIVENQERNFRTTITGLQDSLMTLRRQVDTLKQQVPGLGEYMSTIQLHVSKLWFAGHAANWDLSKFELDELNESIEGSEALHITRNNVNVSSVLQSLQNTQLELLKESIQDKNEKSFVSAYSQTLETCNGCHRSAGYGFIHIITPTSPPVTNQAWILPTEKDQGK